MRHRQLAAAAALLVPQCAAPAIAAPAVAAGPRIGPQEAARHRGERVTLVGPVSQIESRPDGTVLMIGSESPVPVRVAPDVRTRLGGDLGSLRGRELQLT
jgi:hypothetical protein